MKTDVKKDIAVSLFFMLVAIAYLMGTRSISVFSPFGNQGLDSKSIPIMIGGLMIVFSLMFLAVTLLNYRKEKASAAPSVQAQPVASGVRIPFKLLASLVLLCLYIVCYQPVGFVISSAAYLILESFLLTPADKRKKWAIFIVLFSIGFTGGIYILFSKYLSLFLPIGILG